MDYLQKQLAEAQTQLKAAEEQAAQLKAVAEPEKERFFKSGHFTSAVDLAIIEALSLGLARSKVSLRL